MDKYNLFILGSFGNIGTALLKNISLNTNHELFYKIYLIDLNIIPELIPKELSYKCINLPLDLTKDDDLQILFDQFDDKNKNLIINLIAKDYPVLSSRKSDWNSFSPTANEFKEVFNINLLIPYKISKFIIDNKIPQIRFINIGSIYGLRTPHPEIYNYEDQNNKPSPYSITKAGLISLVKYNALEFKKFGSESFMITFGGIKSELQNKEFIKNYNKRTVSGGLLDLEKAAETLLKLCMLPWGTISGSNFIVDNGYTIF